MWSPAGSSACNECPTGRVKKLSVSFDIQTKMLNFPTAVSRYQVWYYQENEQGIQDADCALVPEAIIHIPQLDEFLSYDLPNFFPVISCPYGYSSRVGSYIFKDQQALRSVIASRISNMANNTLEAITDAPYMKLKKTYDWVTPVVGKKCSDMAATEDDIFSSVGSLQDCKIAAFDVAGIEDVRIRTGNIKGCYFLPSVSNKVAYYGYGSEEPCLRNVQYICQEGTNNDKFFSNFVISNCFRCPGNSISGPESGACVTCHANQMKWYAKAAIQQGAELNRLEFVQVDSATTKELPTGATKIVWDLDKVKNLSLIHI